MLTSSSTSLSNPCNKTTLHTVHTTGLIFYKLYHTAGHWGNLTKPDFNFTAVTLRQQVILHSSYTQLALPLIYRMFQYWSTKLWGSVAQLKIYIFYSIPFFQDFECSGPLLPYLPLRVCDPLGFLALCWNLILHLSSPEHQICIKHKNSPAKKHYPRYYWIFLNYGSFWLGALLNWGPFELGIFWPGICLTWGNFYLIPIYISDKNGSCSPHSAQLSGEFPFSHPWSYGHCRKHVVWSCPCSNIICCCTERKNGERLFFPGR